MDSITKMDPEAGHVDRLAARLREAYDELWDSFVDPREAYFDSDGVVWSELGGAEEGRGAWQMAFRTEAEHRAIRARCRGLAATNEFAINGHENRISYIVGRGHTYRAEMKDGVAGPASLATDVQAEIDEFVRENRWFDRQQEIVRRLDRDGEVFLRFFTGATGRLSVRFVEPGLITTPPERLEPANSFGVQTDPRDVETVLAYYIEGELVEAEAIQHRKANVDLNVKRGVPLFYPVHKNLRRAEKLLRNMSVVAEIQSAIALIRRHRRGTRSSVQQFASDRADVTTHDPNTGKTLLHKRYGPGTILDAPRDVEYDFPAASIDAASYVRILQAELRAVASRLVMPEFMLTSDASNSNYSSTMIAEGPAVRMFQRLQAEQIRGDLKVLERVVRQGVHSGRLAHEALSAVEIQASPPTLTVRDELRESQVFRIEHERGILSPQTWSRERGLDYEQEQANLAAHAKGRAQDLRVEESRVARNSR